MAVHCPECGFVNAEGANYCQKCGAYLSRPEGTDEPTTMTYRVDESGEMQVVDIDEVVDNAGAAMVIRSGGGRAGESFPLTDDRLSIGRSPDAGIFLDDVTVSRNHALVVRRRDGLLHRRPRLAQRHIRQPAPDRVPLARRRRRDPDRQVQAQLPGEVVSTPTKPAGELSDRKALTIGAVAKILGQEFDDVSISKIRYLEDQKLLSPRRTPGGYRLYSQADVERLRTILRLQRDEFLPLRVIRQELAAGGERDEAKARACRGEARDQRRAGRRHPADTRRALRRHRRPAVADRRARGLRHRPAAEPATARASTTRPTARSSRPRPSWPATASRAATSRSSAPRPTASRRCSSRSSGRRSTRATRHAAARRSRTSRRSLQRSATSST